MELIRGIESLKSPPKGTVLTIGSFDGVHLGHQLIIKRMVRKAREVKGVGAILTFHPHPLETLQPSTSPSLLTPISKRVKIFDELGADLCIICRFDHNFASMEPGEFVDEVLCQRLRVRILLIGFDYHFGRGREGDANLLRSMGKSKGFQVLELPPVKYRGKVVSSTLIREWIRKGDFRGASKLLGRPYSMEGRVVKGSGRGHRLGYPTANLEPQGQLLPPRGVYAGHLFVGGRKYGALLNIGCRPTFTKRRKLTIEVHAPRLHQGIYDRVVQFAFMERIRDEIAFRSEERLARQIESDKAKASHILKDDFPALQR